MNDQQTGKRAGRNGCPAAINVYGEHFDCDFPTDDNGNHLGWAHSNKGTQTIWTDDRNTIAGGPKP